MHAMPIYAIYTFVDRKKRNIDTYTILRYALALFFFIVSIYPVPSKIFCCSIIYLGSYKLCT